MTEIRPIRESEGEAFLKVLCDSFGLDFNRAYEIFFTEPLYDLNRKWALFEGQQIVSILTTTLLEFGWGNAVGIAGVATIKDRQGEGLARKLIAKVLKMSERNVETGALLFATDVRLYEACGFEGLDRVVRAPIVTLPIEVDRSAMTIAEIKEKYDLWASQHPDRLRRSAKRWEYWQWNFRESYAHHDGYYAMENGLIREAIFTNSDPKMPVARGTEWLGLSFMTDQLEIPLGPLTVPMYLMGRNIPGQPQLFMTDQF
jgi:GNAT superfamily N-acetyltransferase